MTTSSLKPAAISSLTPAKWVPDVDTAIVGSLPFTTRAGAYVDVRGSDSEWPGFACNVPNFTFPGGATLTGFSVTIYGHKGATTFDINDGASKVGEFAGEIFLTNDGSYSGKLPGTAIHIDDLPVGSGNVTISDSVTLGNSSSLWGFNAADLKAKLENNTGPTISLLADTGTFSGNAGDADNNFAIYGGGKIGGTGTWSQADPVAYIAGLDVNQAGGWTPVTQALTAQGQTFHGLYLAIGPISLPTGFEVGTISVFVYGQNVVSAGAAGKINVNGTNGGSKIVASSGMIYIAKGGYAFANKLEGDGITNGHLVLFQTASGTISLAEVQPLVSSSLVGFNSSAELSDALTAPSGANQLYVVIDSGVFYSPTPGVDSRSVQIGPVIVKVHGYLNQDRSRRTIAAIAFNAHYNVPSSGGGASYVATLLIPEEDFNDSLLDDFVKEISKRNNG